MNEDQIVDWLRALYESWLAVISAPADRIGPAYQPDADTVWQAVRFWFRMIAVGFVLSTPMALAVPGGVGDKMRVVFVMLLSLIVGGITVLTFHFPFLWFDGRASLAGSFVTYIYAWGPYIPLQVFGSLILLAGVPPGLRRQVISPSSAAVASGLAFQDDGGFPPMIWLGLLCSWGVQFWGLYVVFRCLSLAHSLEGWEQHAKAIGVAFLIFMPVSAMLQQLNTLAAAERDG